MGTRRVNQIVNRNGQVHRGKCECTCCHNVDKDTQKMCNVEVVILLNSAACVKDFWQKMLNHQTNTIIDKYHSDRSQSSLKIAIHSYSEEAWQIHPTAQEDSSNLGDFTDITWSSGQQGYQSIKQAIRRASGQSSGHIGHTKLGEYQGQGDYIHVGLQRVNEMFQQHGAKDASGNLDSKTRRILYIITNSGVIKGDLNGQSVKAAFDGEMGSLQDNKVDIYVNTVSQRCPTPKACLSCCPDIQFLTKHIT